MTSDPRTWARINDLFHQALDQKPEDREAFLARECGPDRAVLLEVTSLLAAYQRAGAFIEEPAVPGRHGTPSDLAGAAGGTPALQNGQEIGPYRIVRALGVGGMGEVYLAQDSRLGRLVALKALAPAFTADPGRRERLRREARAAAALTHPGIATVYALEEIDEHLYIASEYVEGATLRDELTQGPLSPVRAIETGIDLARALAAAHAKGIVHRDLKPDNIIRTPSGGIKILDFGLAQVDTAGAPLPTLTVEGAAIGTPAYMSPEQVRGETVDARSDLFSLGVVLYEVGSGHNPFRGPDPVASLARVLEWDPPPISTDSVDATELAVLGAFEAVVRRCLRKTPADRFRSADHVAAALERARLGLAPAPTPAPSGTRVVDHGRARGWWQFHQAAASLAYSALLVPLWLAHPPLPAPGALLLFLAGLVASIAASTLRLHLWFTAREYPREWVRQRHRLGGWLRAADLAFVTALAGTGLADVGTSAPMATLLVGAAVAVLLSALVVEPATTRVAFGDS